MVSEPHSVIQFTFFGVIHGFSAVIHSTKYRIEVVLPEVKQPLKKEEVADKGHAVQ
jgi:hypothetical protein